MKRAAKHQPTFFAVILLIAALFCGQITAYAYNPALISEYTSTEFTQTASQYWNVRVSNDALSVELHDSAAGDGRSAALYIKNKNRNCWKKFNNGMCSLSVSLAGLPDGKYIAVIYEARTDLDNTVWSIAKLQVQIKNRNASIYFPYGQSERDFINQLNALCDPMDYLQPLKDYSNLADMTATAKSITADCRTDEEKIKAIHDWMTLNFAYDYESVKNGSTEKASDPQQVFETRRAICSGFARVASVMFTAVGIPCINISGYAKSPLPDNAENKGTNHEWNAVYLNGSWRIMDLTWDCLNKYYGKNSAKNVSGLAGIYTFYGTPAEAAGHSHLSVQATGNPIVPTGTTISKITPASRSLKVSFQKQTAGTTGYQIRCSTNANMKNAKTVTIKKNTVGSKKIKGLKGKKTYYVQIRTYKTVDGKKYYSSWSKKASAQTL